MDDITEKMLAISTIDNPSETRQLYLDIEANLPITVSLTERGIKNLQQQSSELELDKGGVYQIDKLMYAGDMGGILGFVSSKKGVMKKQIVMSITHLNLDPSSPLFDRIHQYQKKRTIGLAIADGGRGRSKSKSKKKKKGFGG